VLHGLLGSLDNWHTFARGQAGKRSVLAMDLRNHGSSPHVQGMSYRQMVADVVEVLDTLAIHTCDLMGHSMGGKVAMALALQHLARIRRLLVVDIAPKAYPPRHQALLQAMAEMPLSGMTSRKQADEWLSMTVKHPFERGFLLKNLGRNPDGGFYWQCNLPEIARHYLKISGFPAHEVFFPGPALFMRGGQSDYVADEDLILIRQTFPAAELVGIEAAGHLPHVQTPVEFTAMVDAFLD
jgi:esterase